MKPGIIAALFVLACVGDPPAGIDVSEDASNLSPAAAHGVLGSASAVELRGGETHAYPISFEDGQYAHLIVEQLGIDVVITLHGPDNTALIQVDRPTSSQGPEEIFWVAEGEGNYHLKITALDAGGQGRYTFKIAAHRFATEEDRKRTRAALLLARGDLETSRQDALPLYMEALASFEKLGDRSSQAYALYRAAFIHWNERKDLERAAQSFERAGELFEEVGNVRLQASSLHSAGRIKIDMGEMEDALAKFEKALPLWRRVGDYKNETAALNNQGIIWRVRGELDKALANYDQVLSRAREAGDLEEEATALNNRGKCYYILGHYKQAQNDLKKALALRERSGETWRQAATLNALGQVLEAQGNLGKALDFFQRALDLNAAQGHRRDRAVTLASMGEVLGRSGQPQEALEAFDQALVIVQELGDQYQEACTLQSMGSLYQTLENSGKARQLYIRAQRLFESVGNSTGEVRNLRLLAEVERKSGDLTASRRYIESALLKVEDLRTKPASPSLRSTFFATRRSVYELYIDLLMDLHQRTPSAGHDAEALSASERARARSQLDILIESGAQLRAGADPLLLAEELRLELQINTLEHRRLKLLEDEPTDELAVVEGQLRALLREYETVRGDIRKSHPRPAVIDLEPLSATEIRDDLVDERTIFLEYKLAERRSFVWAVTHEKIHSFELPSRDEIEEAARQAYRFVSQGSRRESYGATYLALESLSRMILEPVSHLLAEKRVLVVSDGALQYIPFGALPLPEVSLDANKGSRPRPLLAEHEVNHAPSASTLAALRRQVTGRRKAPRRVAVIADPVFQSYDPRLRSQTDSQAPAAEARGGDLRRFERLVYAGQEAEAILGLVSPALSFNAVGFAATREAVLSGELAQYQIVHFATHGDVDSAHPELSRLILSLRDERGAAIPGLLHSHEIYNLSLPAELVVLSACQTALGQDVAGEGLVGLTQAFMSAGAARVLVSLWQVNDRATAELMARFYQLHLIEKLQPTAALREAQLSIAREARWQSPYFWGGFLLQGEW